MTPSKQKSWKYTAHTRLEKSPLKFFSGCASHFSVKPLLIAVQLQPYLYVTAKQSLSTAELVHAVIRSRAQTLYAVGVLQSHNIWMTPHYGSIYQAVISSSPSCCMRPLVEIQQRYLIDSDLRPFSAEVNVAASRQPICQYLRTWLGALTRTFFDTVINNSHSSTRSALSSPSSGFKLTMLQFTTRQT